MRSDVVALARTWIGTPYRHQASCKGAGTDCLGLIRGVWRGLVGEEPAGIPGYTEDWAEPARDESLLKAAETHLIRQASANMVEPGDVLLFRLRDAGIAKHFGIAAKREGVATFIHAYSGHSVVESPLTRPWARRVVARFTFPERKI